MNAVHLWASSFKKSYFGLSTFSNSSLIDCDFSLAATTGSFYENTILNGCNFEQASWILTSFDQVSFVRGNLSECSLLCTSVKNSRLIGCDLKDAMLLDAKSQFQIEGGTPNEITKPIVALGWFADGSGYNTRLIRKAIRHNGSLVLPYEQNSIVDDSMLTTEVVRVLQEMQLAPPNQEQSIGQQLIEKAVPGSEIDRLRHTAKEILKYANGLIIPGGDDIEPFFYDNTAKPSKFAYRTVLELALLSEANHQKIPTMGVCRGAQIINVFFGGTLLGDVKGQVGEQQLEWASPTKELQRLLPEEFRGVSMHHQAVDRVGTGLRIVLKRGTIPKLLLSEDGNFIASQFHPEEYFDVLKSLSELFDMKLMTQEDLGTLKSINTLIQQTLLALQNQSTNASSLANKYFELINRDYLISQREIDFIISNKNIYRFFLDKVERVRNQANKA